MAISSKSTLREIIEDERAVAIINEFQPGFMDNMDDMRPVLGMPYNMLLKFPQTGLDEETQKKMCDALDALDA